MFHHQKIYWVRVTRHEFHRDAEPQVYEWHPDRRHKEFEGWPTWHKGLLDALRDPRGNELWRGVLCGESHNYSAELKARLPCVALLRRVPNLLIYLAAIRALVDVAKKLGPEARQSMFILLDACSYPALCEVPIRREGQRIQSASEPMTPIWNYGAILSRIAPMFGRNRVRYGIEALAVMRQFILDLEMMFPESVERILDQRLIGEDEIPKIFVERGDVIHSTQLALGPLPHFHWLSKDASDTVQKVTL